MVKIKFDIDKLTVSEKNTVFVALLKARRKRNKKRR